MVRQYSKRWPSHIALEINRYDITQPYHGGPPNVKPDKEEINQRKSQEASEKKGTIYLQLLRFS